jgi:hypothetical protein
MCELGWERTSLPNEMPRVYPILADGWVSHDSDADRNLIYRAMTVCDWPRDQDRAQAWRIARECIRGGRAERNRDILTPALLDE